MGKVSPWDFAPKMSQNNLMAEDTLSYGILGVCVCVCVSGQPTAQFSAGKWKNASEKGKLGAARSGGKHISFETEQHALTHTHSAFGL